MPTTCKITRNWKKAGYTIGKFYVDGKYWCNTMEDRDRDLHAGMTEGMILARKVYGETAIPRGQYVLELTRSPKFAGRAWGAKYNGLVPEIVGVKGFVGCRVHPLNTAADSLGCIGLGENTVKGKITNSTAWYYKFMDQVMLPAQRRGEVVILDIQ